MEKPMTEAQKLAISFIEENGCVHAGFNVSRRGSQYDVKASCLMALERQGKVELKISPDGGMMAVYSKEFKEQIAMTQEMVAEVIAEEKAGK